MSGSPVILKCKKCGSPKTVVLPAKPGSYKTPCANPTCDEFIHFNVAPPREQIGKLVMCPNCKSKIAIPASYSSPQFRCPRCQYISQVDEAQTEIPATPVQQPEPQVAPSKAATHDNGGYQEPEKTLTDSEVPRIPPVNNAPREPRKPVAPTPKPVEAAANDLKNIPSQNQGIRVGVERITIEELRRRQQAKKAAAAGRQQPVEQPAEPVQERTRIHQPVAAPMPQKPAPAPTPQPTPAPFPPPAPQPSPQPSQNHPRTVAINNMPPQPRSHSVSKGMGRCDLMIKQLYGLREKRFPLRPGHNIVGRKDHEQPSDIQIDNDSAISRRSIDIEVKQTPTGYIYSLTVLRALNPVLHNRVPHKQGETVYLAHNDTITLGNTTLWFVPSKK